MSKNPNKELIEVRTFASMEEIRALSGFVEKNPINQENYNQIIGDYDFQDEVECCMEVQKGSLCNHKHKHGFVVKLKDNSITIIGNVCAKNKFDAKANFIKDKNKYLNTKRFLKNQEQLNELLSNKDQILHEIKLLKTELDEMKKRVTNFGESLGRKTYRKLKAMSRDNSTHIITVKTMTINRYKNDKGEEKEDKKPGQEVIGTLRDVDIFNFRNTQSIITDMRSVIKAFNDAESISGKVKSSQIEKTANSIKNLDRIRNDVNKILKKEARFFNNKLLPLCYLVDDINERAKTTRAIMAIAGTEIGKDKAKNWILDHDQNLVNDYKVDKFEILD